MPVCIEVSGDFLEIARDGDTHKYLGEMIASNPRARGMENLAHRTTITWMKFHTHWYTLRHGQLPLGLRIKMFNAGVSPAALHSLSSTHLTAATLETLDTTQRKVLRNIVGWPQDTTQTWEERGTAMKTKLDNAFSKFGLQSIIETLQSQKQTLQQRKLLDHCVATMESTLGTECC